MSIRLPLGGWGRVVHASAAAPTEPNPWLFLFITAYGIVALVYSVRYLLTSHEPRRGFLASSKRGRVASLLCCAPFVIVIGVLGLVHAITGG